jgi:hypothetical protein
MRAALWAAYQLSIGNARVRPHRTKIPQPIDAKIGTIDYVGKIT